MFGGKRNFIFFLFFLLFAQNGRGENFLKADSLRVFEVGEIGKTQAVKMLYDVDFATYFDNREYHEPYQIPQTIFNFRLSPSIGVRVLDGLSGRHELVAGVHYSQPLGGNFREAWATPTAYYRFWRGGFSVALGAVPLAERISAMPEFLMYDSITYAQPNVQGALFSYADGRGFVEFMCDWRGRQTTQRREKFRLVLNGFYRWRFLQIGGWAQMNHLAGFAPPVAKVGVCDDVVFMPQIGFDVSPYAKMDSLAFRVSYLAGVQRFRARNDSRITNGVLAEIYANWKFLGLKNSFYFGENLMPFYADLGAELNQGDPFYRAKIYNRLDVFAYLYRNNFVNCYFSWNLHYDGVSLAHQQQLIARFSLQGMRKKRNLRGLFDK